MNYDKSVLVAKESENSTEVKTSKSVSKPELATGILIGKRLPSFKVLNQSDARPWHLQELLKSNGRWRLIVFPGRLNDVESKKRFDSLGAKLAGGNSIIKRFTPPQQPVDSVIEILTVHAGPRTEIELQDLHQAFHPYDEKLGWDYWKVYVDDQSYHEGHGKAYANYGIDPVRGASIIVRPDQYVSWVGEIDDYESMDMFFSGFMKEQSVAK